MKFNKDKCEVSAKKKSNVQIQNAENWPGISEAENDGGVIMDPKLNLSR